MPKHHYRGHVSGGYMHNIGRPVVSILSHLFDFVQWKTRFLAGFRNSDKAQPASLCNLTSLFSTFLS